MSVGHFSGGLILDVVCNYVERRKERVLAVLDQGVVTVSLEVIFAVVKSNVVRITPDGADIRSCEIRRKK